MARERVNTFSEEPFTNSIGQTLQPGDKVVAVTTGYGHSVSVFEGIFEGVYRGPTWNSKDEQTVNGTRIGQIPKNIYERVYTLDGMHEETRFDFKSSKSIPTGKRYNLVRRMTYRKSSLQRNRVFKIDTALTKVTI